MADIVIVGAGPAGVRAAETLVAHGLRPVLLDEGSRAGGQGYRAVPHASAADICRLMGSEAGKFAALHASFAVLRPMLDYRPDTLAWAVHEKVLHLASGGAAETLPYDALIVASGATDRVLPIPGWTLPGVVTLGAAQVALKQSGCFVGRRTVFCGSSPLLLLAALQYARAGAEVVAVCDTTAWRDKLRAMPGLRHAPRTALRGLGYLAALRRLGVPVLHGVSLLGIEGEQAATGLRLRDAAGQERVLSCDAVAMGHGLRAEPQLAELAGASFRYDPGFRQWLPRIDADGRAGPGLYLAGDGAAIGGADAAEASGRLAAEALLVDLGLRGRTTPGLRGRVARLRRFQRGLAGAFRWPHERAAALADPTVVCRCEGVTAGEIRAAIRAPLGPAEVNRVKAITRCGMGRCQGRMCGAALAELVSATAGVSHEAAGRLRGQAPVKPVPLDLAVP